MKNVEKWQIERFLELLGDDAPQGKLSYPNPPDVLITADNACIAIEHTRIVRPVVPGHNLRAYEKRTDDIAFKARKAFEAERSDRLQVELDFDDSILLARSDEDVIAQTTAAVVAAHMPPVGSECFLESWRFHTKERLFPRAVETIWIYNFPEWETHWTVPRSTTVPNLTAEVVQMHIVRKEKKLASYRKACGEVWLLLVVEGFAPSGQWGLDRLPTDHQFDSSFDRVFLYHHFTREIQELRCRPTHRDM